MSARAIEQDEIEQRFVSTITRNGVERTLYKPGSKVYSDALWKLRSRAITYAEFKEITGKW